MGAIKAGVTIVTFDEKDNKEALDKVLRDSKARGLLFSPDTEIDEENNRGTYLKSLMP